MLTTDLRVVDKDGTILLDLVDDKTPNGRAMSIRIPLRWDGLVALRSAIEVVFARKTDAAKIVETKGHTFQKMEIKKK